MLSDAVIETQVIKFRGGEFAVRGLGLDLISQLMADGNRDEIEAAVAQLEILYEAIGTNDESVIGPGMSKLITQLPSLAAKIIAYAADEPSQVAKVRQLPMPIQLDALIAIGRLTFDGPDSVKNFVNNLTTLRISLGQTAATATGGRIAPPIPSPPPPNIPPKIPPNIPPLPNIPSDVPPAIQPPEEVSAAPQPKPSPRPRSRRKRTAAPV